MGLWALPNPYLCTQGPDPARVASQLSPGAPGLGGGRGWALACRLSSAHTGLQQGGLGEGSKA